MVLFPEAPPANAWEHVLVDKIFQKGGDGSQGIARYLSRHVRASDHTPPGAILNADFRRSIAELNVACDDASYARVAESCAFESALEPPGRSLSVRALADRLANLARHGGGLAAIYAPSAPSPLTGVETKRVPLSIHEAARYDAKRGSVNDPDYYPPDRGLPSSPRAPPATADPNGMLYDNPAGVGDFVGSPGRRAPNASSSSPLEGDQGASFASPPATRRANDSPSPGDPADPAGRAFPPGTSPDREAMRAFEARKKRDVEEGRVSPVGVPPAAETPFNYEPDPMPALDTAEKVEEATRAALLARTSDRGVAMRILGGMHSKGGRLPAHEKIDLEQFKRALLRVNVNPADERVTRAVFEKHDADKNGSLDYQEFVRYLLPGDFEPTSPREYRANYRGYAARAGAFVPGGGAAEADEKAKEADEAEASAPPATPSRGLGSIASAPFSEPSRLSEPVSPAGRPLDRGVSGGSPPRGAQRPGMLQRSPLSGRDARMHGLAPASSNVAGRATAGAPSYKSGLFLANPAGGDHDMSTRRIEEAIVTKLRGANGGDATARQLARLFRFFDEDGAGFVSSEGLRAALRRLNVDPTDEAFEAFRAKYDPTDTGAFEWRSLAATLVPPSEQEKAAAAKLRGGKSERWGSDGRGRAVWAGYDKAALGAQLEKMQEPSTFDDGKAGDAGYVPVTRTVRELEQLLAEKTRERASNKGKGARAFWKHFDRDGSGAMDRDEFETALFHFNIVPTAEVMDEVMLKYDADGDGQLDYCEMLKVLCPEGDAHRDADTVAMLRRLDGSGGGEAQRSETRAPIEGPTLRPSPPRPVFGAPRPVNFEQNTTRVTVAAFRRMLLEWMSTRGRGLRGLRKLFKDFDADGGGAMDREEFARGIQRMNIHPRPEDLTAIVNHYDADGNGRIEFDEFVRSVLPEHERAGYDAGNWQAIAHSDPKPPNIMPTSHMLYGTQLERQIAEKVLQKADKGGSARMVFRELDWDHSGTVSPEEFRAWIRAMNFFPDDKAFRDLWRAYDPEGKGHVSYQDFVDRVMPKQDLERSAF